MDRRSLFGNDVFERGVGERRRLEYQFELLREDFDLWFDAALRLGGLDTDPSRAAASSSSSQARWANVLCSHRSAGVGDRHSTAGFLSSQGVRTAPTTVSAGARNRSVRWRRWG